MIITFLFSFFFFLASAIPTRGSTNGTSSSAFSSQSEILNTEVRKNSFVFKQLFHFITLLMVKSRILTYYSNLKGSRKWGRNLKPSGCVNQGIATTVSVPKTHGRTKNLTSSSCSYPQKSWYIMIMIDAWW